MKFARCHCLHHLRPFPSDKNIKLSLQKPTEIPTILKVEKTSLKVILQYHLHLYACGPCNDDFSYCENDNN